MKKKNVIRGIVYAAGIGAFGATCYILGRNKTFEECSKSCEKVLDAYGFLCLNHVLKNITLFKPELTDDINRFIKDWNEGYAPQKLSIIWSLKDGGSVKYKEDSVQYTYF